MAARVRTRRLTPPSGALLAVLLSACDREQPQASRPDALPRDVDVAAMPADEIPTAVVRQCQPGLNGMERFAAKVWLPDDTLIAVFGHLPGRLRVQWPDGEIQLLADDRVVRLHNAAPAEELPAAGAARLLALRALLDAATLGPLRRATGCTRSGDRSFLLAQADGAPCELTLQARALLVEQLRLPGSQGRQDTTVRVLEHLRTSTTWIVRSAAVEPLGVCRIRFDATDFTWDESVFQSVPALSGPPAAERTMRVGAEVRPTTPRLEPTTPHRWILVDDPGTWTERASVVQQHVRILEQHGQDLAGFPGFALDGERMRLVIPYRGRRGQPAFTPPSEWQVREVATGRALVVFPTAGDLPRRTAEGEQLLRAALAAQRLEPDGPVLTQPYLHLEEGVPAAEQLADPVVRVSIAVR